MKIKFDRWMLLGYVAAIFNPVPTGLLAGYILYREKKYRTTGAVVMIASVVLFLVAVAVALYYPSLLV